MKKYRMTVIAVVCLPLAGAFGQVQEPARNNYVHTSVYTKAGGAAHIDRIAYFDGLGNLSQTVEKGVTPEKKDLISLCAYDVHGRLNKRWLPVPAAHNDGRYVASDSLKLMAERYFADDYPYTETVYQQNALDLIAKQYNVGSVFRNAEKSVRTTYGTNQSEIMRVRPGNGTIDFSSNYPPYSLYRIVAINEDGHEIETYMDGNGHVVRSRQVNDTENCDTYYGYDPAGRLRVIVMPDGVERLRGQANVSIDSPLVQGNCYYYDYDKAGDLKETHVPDGVYEQLRYDDRHRLIRRYNGYRLYDAPHYRQISELYTYDNLNRVKDTWLLYTTFAEGTHDPDVYVECTATDSLPPASGSMEATERLSFYRYDSYEGVPQHLAFAPVGNYTSYDPRVGGMKTYEKLRILDDLSGLGKVQAKFVERAYYYDADGRLLQTVESIPHGGLIRTTHGYDFVGHIVYSHEQVRPYAGAPVDEFTQEWKYDHAGRLESHWIELNGAGSMGVRYVCDESGYLCYKGTGHIGETREYNLQGWLTSQQNPYFNISYRYYDSLANGSPASYIGNLMQNEWQHMGQSKVVRNIQYDKLGRYKAFVQTDDQNMWQEAVGYDGNGNLRKHSRMNASEGDLFNWSYNYANNRLVTVNGRRFMFDKRGNMTRNPLNGLEFTYNMLNLPYRIGQAGGDTTYYLYLADGTKYSALDATGTGLVYLGSLIYQAVAGRPQALESAGVDDGRIVVSHGPDGAVYTCLYYVRDHVGSIRCIVDDHRSIVEQNDYYPFGERISVSEGTTQNRYLFHGKEEQWTGAAGLLDYGARFYDPALCRWMTLDPEAANTPSVSPYAYCANNPVRYIDPDGKIIRINTFVENRLVTFEWRQYRGKWGFYDDENVLYAGDDYFVNSLTDALIRLMEGGPVGEAVISGLANHENVVTVESAKNSALYLYRDKNVLGWNPIGPENVPTTSGFRNDPFIALGHELGHVANWWSGEKNGHWYEMSTLNDRDELVPQSISTAEIYATHIENCLRAENKIPLRTQYGIDPMGKGVGPRIIDPSTGASVYYDATGFTNYKPLKKGVTPYFYK